MTVKVHCKYCSFPDQRLESLPDLSAIRPESRLQPGVSVCLENISILIFIASIMNYEQLRIWMWTIRAVNAKLMDMNET